MLFARLGLRTCEIVRMELEDVDWELGQITVRGKGGRWSKLLETFFTDRLIAQRRVSPHTVASYRDTFRLLLNFAQKELGSRHPNSQ
jgi:site-specific recombinase XerC